MNKHLFPVDIMSLSGSRKKAKPSDSKGNGEKNVDQVVEEPENSGIGIQSWSGFVDCLNNAGVSAWAITALSVACSAICVGTAGTGCAPCLYAASSITGGTLGWCVGSNL